MKKRWKNPIVGNLHEKSDKNFITNFGLYYRKKLHSLFSSICHFSTNSKKISDNSELWSKCKILKNLYSKFVNSEKGIVSRKSKKSIRKTQKMNSKLEKLKEEIQQINANTKENKIVIDYYGKLDPKEQYIFVCNHTCPEDIETILNVLDRNAHLVLGSIESARYDRDVLCLWLLNGVLPFDILNQQQRNDLPTKMRRILERTSLFIFPEASHNYSANNIVNPLFSGPVNLNLGLEPPKNKSKKVDVSEREKEQFIEEQANNILSIIIGINKGRLNCGNLANVKNTLSIVEVSGELKNILTRTIDLLNESSLSAFSSKIDGDNYKRSLDLIRKDIVDNLRGVQNVTNNSQASDEAIYPSKKIVTVTLIRDQESNTSYFNISDSFNLEDKYPTVGILDTKSKVEYLSDCLRDEMASAAFKLMKTYLPTFDRSQYEDIYTHFMRQNVVDAFEKLHWDETEEVVRSLNSVDSTPDIFDKEYLVRVPQEKKDQEDVEQILYLQKNIQLEHKLNSTSYWMRRAYWKRKTLLEKIGMTKNKEELYDVLMDIQKLLTFDEFGNTTDLELAKEAMVVVKKKMFNHASVKTVRLEAQQFVKKHIV